MTLPLGNPGDVLLQLGAGQSIAAICETAGLTRSEFDRWWQIECRKRVPENAGHVRVNVRHGVRVDFDRWGIPYIYAANDDDLFFTLGYLTARDRLFQIDYLRRKATGRLSELLGRDALASDITYRTLGLSQIAETEWQSLPSEPRAALQSYTDGINAWIAMPSSPWPVEFDLLGYCPEPWQPQDSLVILGEFRWYLSGRLPVVVVPELIKRKLGDGPLYHATLVGEADDESILWPGEYSRAQNCGPIRPSGGGGVDSPGSNNWVLSGRRTDSGSPAMAGDPHLIFSALPIWFEARLKGGSFDLAGVGLAGLPGVMVGRTRKISWTITNNICSQRDLYQEQIRPGARPSFLFDGKWEAAAERCEAIHVKGSETVQKRILYSRNGPIVDELLPAAAHGTGPVSLRWVGQQPCGLLTALLGMNRAQSVQEFCDSTRPWLCPTWNLLCADVDGRIGLQTTGRIPHRTIWERGYRRGWDPRHQWTALLTFEDMPRLVDPPRGFIVTANNRLAPNDYPISLDCAATSGHRARRARQEIERREVLATSDHKSLQLDTFSLRAAECVPLLLQNLADSNNQRFQQAVGYLQAWDHHVVPSSIAATIFNVFFMNWSRTVARERLCERTGDDSVALLAADRLGGLAARLLKSDPHVWFRRKPRTAAITAAFESTLHELSQKLGADMDRWQWGRLHMLLQPHPLSGRGDLGSLLDLSGIPLAGDGTTLYNTTPNASVAAYLGPVYRTIVELSDPDFGMWAINSASASAHVGSPHYHDQLEPWSRGEYRYLSLDTDRAAAAAMETLHLTPNGQGG